MKLKQDIEGVRWTSLPTVLCGCDWNQCWLLRKVTRKPSETSFQASCIMGFMWPWKGRGISRACPPIFIFSNHPIPSLALEDHPKSSDTTKQRGNELNEVSNLPGKVAQISIHVNSIQRAWTAFTPSQIRATLKRRFLMSRVSGNFNEINS